MDVGDNSSTTKETPAKATAPKKVRLTFFILFIVFVRYKYHSCFYNLFSIVTKKHLLTPNNLTIWIVGS